MVLCDGVCALILAHKRFLIGKTPAFVTREWFTENDKHLDDDLVDRANILFDILNSVAVCGYPSPEFLDNLSTEADPSESGLVRVNFKTRKALEKYLCQSIVFLALSLSYCFARGFGEHPGKDTDTVAKIRDGTERGLATARRMNHFMHYFFKVINEKMPAPVPEIPYENKRIMVGFQYPLKGDAKKYGLFSDSWYGANMSYKCTRREKRVWLSHFLALGMCSKGVLDATLHASKGPSAISEEEFDVMESCYSTKGRYASMKLF
jgi:hypothetical protein